jgi:hypothetical protein
MSSERSGCGRWLACGLGCLFALGSFAALLVVVGLAVHSGRLTWPGRDTPSASGAPPSTAPARDFPVAPGDPRRLALPLPGPGEERPLGSLYHREAGPPPADDFLFGPESAAAPAGDLPARLGSARQRRDAAYERYTRLVTEGGEGSVQDALAEYRAAVEALKALEAEAGR